MPRSTGTSRSGCEPEELAAAIVFLASDDASSSTASRLQSMGAG